MVGDIDYRDRENASLRTQLAEKTDEAERLGKENVVLSGMVFWLSEDLAEKTGHPIPYHENRAREMVERARKQTAFQLKEKADHEL